VFDGEVEISPDGREVAYVVKAPNVETNENEFRVYSRDLDQPSEKTNGRLLMKSGGALYGLKWVARNRGLMVLDSAENNHIVEVDSETSARRAILTSGEPISSFSVDASGDLIVYATDVKKSRATMHEAYVTHGFPVVFGRGLAPPGEAYDELEQESAIYVANRQDDGHFVSTKLTGQGLELLRDVRGLSVSPSGRYLIFSYRADRVDSAWKWVEMFRWNPVMLGLYDFQTRKLRPAFDSPMANWGLPVAWDMDSRAFAVNAVSPGGTVWAQRDRQKGFVDGAQYERYYHTFAVDVSTGDISEVAEHPCLFYASQVLYWSTTQGKLLIRKNSESYAWLTPSYPEWQEVNTSRVSKGSTGIYSMIDRSRINTTSDGRKIVGVYGDKGTPPDVFIHDLQLNQTKILTDLNPEFRSIALQPLENIEWRDRFGLEHEGFLIKPIRYEPTRRYPLVIMAKAWLEDYFVTDTQYQTAFPPQVLADAGFVVLMAPDVDRGKVATNSVLQKYRNKAMSESVEFTAMVQSGIDMLVHRGLADAKNVGVIGFSSTSWEIDAMLSHSKIHFAAASSADSGLWNYSVYWNSNLAVVAEIAEDYMGGPPYGKTFRNWLKFSPAFNAYWVATPLLMEYTQRGAFNPSIDGLEFFTALKKQNKPVDLFFYPRGAHVLDTPFERRASLQRNVDWFRFWMQHYEGTAPTYDPEQYVRWRKLLDRRR
jgi:dipeptidyl aminopeptidase/acylaminoacyl peptidase